MDDIHWPSLSFAILLASLLVSGYILWRRYRSRRALLQRIAELEALSAAGSAIVAARLDVTALCELIAQEAGKVIDNSTFQVGLFDNQFYHILFWTINGRRQTTPQTFDLSEHSGIIGWTRQTRQPLLVHDFTKEMNSLPATPRYISDSPPRSAVFLPLIQGDEVIGIVAAQSGQPNRFNERDLRLLMILANQAAAAIANAQLYQQERMRATHLEMVSRMARQVNAVQDLDEIFSEVVRLTEETFDFHPVNIFSVDGSTGEAVIQASSDPSLSPNSLRLPAGAGIVGTAVTTQKTIVVNKTAEDERFIANINNFGPPPDLPTQAEIAIPLIVNGNVLGVLDVQSPQAGVFTATEKTVLEALAAEVASAIHKAQQLARQRERAWITSAQFQVAEGLSRSDDVEQIVTTIARLTRPLVGVSFCGILLWDEEMEEYRGTSLIGVDDKTAEAFAHLHLTIGDWHALDAVHVGQTALTTSQIPAWLRKAAAQLEPPVNQLTLLPLSAKNKTFGVLIVSRSNLSSTITNSVDNLDDRRMELLHNIANQTAQALESAYLRAAQQEEAWVNTALLQVAEAVNRLIDLNEILDTIVRLVPLLVGVESALVLIWDEARAVFRPGPSYGISPMGRGLLDTLEIEEADLPVLAPQSSDFRSLNATYFTFQLPPWLVKVLGATTGYAFPLYARGRLVGALVVGTKAEKGRPLSNRRLNILNGIAHQAATAVVNHQLYQEAAERDRLEQELSVARQIQASLIPPGSPDIVGCSVASYWQAAQQVSGDFYDFLELPGGHWGIVVADVAGKGVPAALFMAVCRTIVRTIGFNRQDPAQVLMRANEIINKDTRSDLFITIFYAMWNPQTETLTYANGGHNPPLLLCHDGRTHLLRSRGMALGVLPQISLESRSVRLQPGDTLVCYTDGVTEALNEDYDEFGLERLRLAADSARHLDAPGIVRAITQDIRTHAGDTPQFDDITLVVIKREQ